MQLERGGKERKKCWVTGQSQTSRKYSFRGGDPKMLAAGRSQACFFLSIEVKCSPSMNVKLILHWKLSISLSQVSATDLAEVICVRENDKIEFISVDPSV